MSWSIVLLVLVSLFCFTALVAIFNLLKKVESLEEYNQELEEFILKMQEDTKEVLENIRAVDIRGSFESDDEVGVIFDGIKGMVQRLNVFLRTEE